MSGLLRIAPGYDEAWFRRGSACGSMERHDEALASYGKALECNPGRFGAVFNSATILLKLERYGEAFAAFEAAARPRARSSYVLGGLASAVRVAAISRRWQDIQALVGRAVRDKSAVIAPLVLLPFSDDGALRRRCSENFVADRIASQIRRFGTADTTSMTASRSPICRPIFTSTPPPS